MLLAKATPFTNIVPLVSRHIPRLPPVEKLPAKEEVGKKVRKKPTYAFSKRELVSLARFSGEEATGNVVEWLELQGNLLD